MGTTAQGLRYPEPTGRVNQGHVDLANLADDVDAKLTMHGAWSAFNLSAAGSSGITTYGTGPTFACAWKLIGDKTAAVRLAVTFGTSPNVSGTMSLGPLPFTVAAPSMQVGTGVIFKGAGTPTGIVCTFSGTVVTRMYTTHSQQMLSNTVPWTWAAADQIRISAVVELA